MTAQQKRLNRRMQAFANRCIAQNLDDQKREGIFRSLRSLKKGPWNLCQEKTISYWLGSIREEKIDDSVDTEIKRLLKHFPAQPGHLHHKNGNGKHQ